MKTLINFLQFICLVIASANLLTVVTKPTFVWCCVPLCIITFFVHLLLNVLLDDEVNEVMEIINEINKANDSKRS